MYTTKHYEKYLNIIPYDLSHYTVIFKVRLLSKLCAGIYLHITISWRIFLPQRASLQIKLSISCLTFMIFIGGFTH